MVVRPRLRRERHRGTRGAHGPQPLRLFEAVDGPDATVVHAGAVEQSPSGWWVVRQRRTLCSRSVTKPRRARRRFGRAWDLKNVNCRQCLRQLAKLEKTGKLTNR